MEKLAFGLVLVCLLYIILLFGLAYCLEQWNTSKEKAGRWFRIRKTRSDNPVLKEMMNYFMKDNWRKVA